MTGNMRNLLSISICFFLTFCVMVQTKCIYPKASEKPGKYQKQQIKRKYGMFIHFGINTFHNEEWTDGSKPAYSYMPCNH